MRPVLDAWVQMIAAARAAGVPVIYTTPVSRSDGADVVMPLTDLSAETGVPPLTNAVEGSAEAGFLDDIAPRPEDYVFLKRRPSAFYGTGVAELLHMLRRDTIIIGGGATNLGVHTTSPTCYRVTRDGPNEGTWEEVMRFGFFDQLPCAPGYSEPQRYKDIIAQIELGDAVGFDTAWLGEIHFIREFSILSDPLMVLAAAAQRTSRIRLGTAVTLLPLHSPIKIAEEAAIADILSDGRLEFGVGRGIARHNASYGIPPEESRGRFDEALDFILAAWTNDSFSFDGKYFQARELTLVPRPVQTPHPPVRIAANSPDTFPLAARHRLPIFASPLINPPDKLKAGLVVYRQGLPAGTVDDTALAFPVHVASSRAQARAECEPGLLRFLRVATEAALPSVQSDPKSFEAFRQVRARMERVTYADMDREMGVFGDPEYCIARVRELQAEYGFDEFICYFNQGGLMDPALVKQSMTLFAQQVMPYFR